MGEINQSWPEDNGRSTRSTAQLVAWDEALIGISSTLTITSSLNQILEGLAPADANVEEAIQACKKIDYDITVPTNFVMRRCLQPTNIEGIAVGQGDLVYVFLGSASGCPFSRLTALACAGCRWCIAAHPLNPAEPWPFWRTAIQSARHPIHRSEGSPRILSPCLSDEDLQQILRSSRNSPVA